MEKLLWNDLGTKEDYHKVFGDELLVNHIVVNGMLDKKVIAEQPFSKFGNLISLFDGKLDVAQKIVGRIDQLNERIQMSA